MQLLLLNRLQLIDKGIYKFPGDTGHCSHLQVCDVLFKIVRRVVGMAAKKHWDFKIKTSERGISVKESKMILQVEDQGRSG